MARRSIFGFLSTALGGEVTSFIDLEHSKDDNKDLDKSDITKIEISDQDFTTPSLNIESSSTPDIPLIGIGGAGIRLLSKVVSRVNSYGINYPTLGIDSDTSDLLKYKNLTHKFEIPGATTGSAHQYKVAGERVKKAEGSIVEGINQYLQDLNMTHSHEVVFLLMGSGGTGVGVGIEIARILIEMGKRPVPFLILPTKDEMTRIKFNAAAALYHFSFAPRDRCLNLITIVIDNERFMVNNSRKHYSSVISASNERIAATLGDIIATTELESHAYSFDLNEFLEVFRDLKSIGVLQYLQIKHPGHDMAKIFDKQLEDSLSLDIDIYSATRSYFYISSTHKQIHAEAYRDLFLRFGNMDMFSKFHETSAEDEFIAIRAIYTGLKITPYIEELMELANHVRVDVLNSEIDQSRSGRSIPKIDARKDGEVLDVKTGEELRDENSEDFARMQREGDH